MASRDLVLTGIQRAEGTICDDCLTARLGLRARQVAHKEGTVLASLGSVGRGRAACGVCGREKLVSWRSTGLPAPAPAISADVALQAGQVERPWYWEGNVQSRLAGWLEGSGHRILRVANTATRESGKDIVALAPDERELWVSIKGYPERSSYTQARHWFAGAVLDLILYRAENTRARLALGLPDGFATYTNLANRTAWLQLDMPFAIFWVSETGQVRSRS
jgi:hypothetical protein